MIQRMTMEYSNIAQYTNAKGISHDAHFNPRGKYIGSVKKLGSVPIQIKQPIARCIAVVAEPIPDVSLLLVQIKQLQLENQQLRDQNAKLYVCP